MGLLSNLFGGSSANYKELIEEGAVVVDVRTPQEFKSGHVKGSKNIPLQTLSARMSELEGKVVVLVCRSGGRAASARSMLKRNGIVAHNAGAWQNISR